MSKFGERLRKARESQGLSLAQAAMETCILQQWLIALEEGAYDRFSNDVVAKGFIRNYAQFLGLPVQEMLDLYRRERGDSESIRIVPATTMTSKRSYVLPSFFGVFFVTILLVGLSYAALSAAGHIGTPQIAEKPEVPEFTLPTPVPMSLSEVTPEVQGSLPESQTETPEETTLTDVGASDAVRSDAIPTPVRVLPTPTRRPAAGMVVSTPTPQSGAATVPFVIEINIKPDSSGSWIRVSTDGIVAYEEIMQAGDSKIFRAEHQVQIRAGNPTAVDVSVNGMQPETLGNVPGQPVNWSWPPL
jgi:cytoskeletal protein RodZ